MKVGILALGNKFRMKKHNDGDDDGDDDDDDDMYIVVFYDTPVHLYIYGVLTFDPFTRHVYF